MKLRGRLGELAERNFRLIFCSTTVSALGDGVSSIALVFAVLQINDSATALGIVLASRQVAMAAITLAAGVIADRLPIASSVIAIVCWLIVVVQPSAWAVRNAPIPEPVPA